MFRAKAVAKSFVKSSPVLYQLALKIFFGWRQFKYGLRVFPLPLGRSPYDSLGKRRELSGLTEYSSNSPQSTRDLDWTQDSVRVESLAGYESYFFPVSFSWPNTQVNTGSDFAVPDRRVVASIIPGEPYSFEDYASYLREYQSSKFGITIKKGGWDCFRHLEITAAGAIPLMPDVARCPDWAMFHYPKGAMRQVVERFKRGEDLPIEAWADFQRWFEKHLTSTAMAGFILKRVCYQSGRIIFLDAGLNSIPDYLSVMTYKGLKEQLGPDNVIAPLGSESVYSDWTGDTANLHGLGFGYTKVLDASFRSLEEVSARGLTEALRLITDEDFVVVGNVSRNIELANSVNSLSRSPDRSLFIWGDDRSPDRAQIRWLKSLAGFKAIREFYPSPKMLAR